MIDLAFLTEAEQEAILKVLHRDAELKKSEEERVRHLPDIVSDENELKYKSGQWFYEAKSKRHSDKIHGADLVRASIRKRKKPSTIELFGVMDVPDEADEDLMPNKAETNQSAKRVSFSSTDLDKDILRNGLSSPAKQRKNPFNSKGLEDVTDSIPEGDQVNGQLEAKPGAEPLYAVVNKTPKVNSLNPAEEFAMEDALREPWFLGQGWKTPNTYQSEKPLVFGQSYGGGGKISFESRYPTRKPEESYIFTREPFLAPERAANIESSYSDLKNKTMATPQYDNDYVESVAAWRRPFLENKESLRRPTTDDPEQQKTSTRTVQKVPKVDFKDEGLLASAYAENEANSKYFPGDYKRETKYEPLFLRNTHNADRPAGPNLKSANFKVMSLKERMNEMPRQQMFDPSQFQSLKNFWTVEEKNLQTADVDTSPNKLLTDILNRNKPTRADLKQRNSREIPGDDLVFPNTFDSLSEEEQTSQKVASWLAQTPTVYGVNKVDHSEEPFEPGKEVIENIQKSAAIKKTNAEDFTSALQKLQIEASESPRIAEPEELRTEEISAVSLNSEEKRPPAADINTTYEQVLKRSTKPTAGKDTNLIVWDIPTMRSVQSEHSVGEPVEETVSKTVAPAKEESAFNIGLEKLQTEYAKPNEECQMDESNLPYEDLYEEDANEPEAVIEKSNAPKSRDQLDFISSLNKLEIEASKPLFLPTEDQDNLPEEEITLNTVSPVKSSYKIGFEHIISPEDNSPFQSPVEHSLTYQAPRYYPPNNTHSAEVVNEYEETVEKITVPKVESDLCSALKKLEIESQSNNENVEQDLEKSKINPSLQANKSPVQTTFIKSSTPLSSTEKEQPDLQLSYSNRAGRSVSAVEETPKEYSYEAKPMFQIELPKYTANTQENLPVEEEETIERTIVGTEENSGDFQNRLMRLQDEAATVSVESGDRSVYETVIFSESPNRKVISKIVFPSIESLPTYSYGTHDAEKTNEVVSNESSPWSKPKDHNEQKSPAYSRLEELAKYPRSADKSGFYNGDARNVLYKKPEISTGVSNSEPGMEDSNPILSALKRSAAKTLNSKAVQEVSPTSTNEVTLDTPKPDVLASTMNSFPDNADKFKRMSQSVPAFLQDDTDGRETDSASESSFKIGRHRKSPSSLTNLSGSSGMASMSSVSGSVASMYSGDFGNVDVKGSIEFSVDYLEPVKEFLIYIYQCKELSVADVKKQRSDPYVKAYLLPEKLKMGKRKTAFKKKTLNPVYNEILRYKIPKEPLLKQTLNLSVWHHDVLGRNSFLGEVNVQLDTWDWNNSQRNWYPLEPRTPASGIGLENRGEIKLALKYIPVSPTVTGAKAGTTGEVHIWIKECLQLPMLRENKINSFVKCTILPDTSRKSRQKTRAVDKTPNPIFNHTMVYDGFKPDDLKEACVELTVWDHNRLSNHFIGGLRLGLGTGKSYGTAVDWMDSSHEETIMWERMGTSPNTWVEGLLPLRMFKMAKLAK